MHKKVTSYCVKALNIRYYDIWCMVIEVCESMLETLIHASLPRWYGSSTLLWGTETESLWNA
jgi:hypothetical protein